MEKFTVLHLFIFFLHLVHLSSQRQITTRACKHRSRDSQAAGLLDRVLVNCRPARVREFGEKKSVTFSNLMKMLTGKHT